MLLLCPCLRLLFLHHLIISHFHIRLRYSSSSFAAAAAAPAAAAASGLTSVCSLVEFDCSRRHVIPCLILAVYQTQ